MCREPAEHAFPTVRVACAQFVRVTKTFMADDHARATFDRRQAPRARGHSVGRVPIGFPGLNELGRWFDLAELPVHRESLSIRADTIAAPRAADAKLASPLRDAIELRRTPPERHFFRSNRAKYALHRRSDVERGEQHALSHIGNGTSCTILQSTHRSFSRYRFKLLRLSIQNAR